jgi:ABC-type multidrug transport system fused ATPase/permease subunit
MYYNWPEIFKEKSDKELYDIYIGRTSLPIEAIELAKAELEKRNFDFDNANNLIFEQKYDRIAEEVAEINLYLQRKPKESIKFLLVVCVISLILELIFFWYVKMHLIIAVIVAVFVAVVTLIMHFIKNYTHKEKTERLHQLEEEMRVLLEQKNQTIVYEKEKIEMSDFENTVNKKIDESLNISLKIAIVFAVVFIIIMIFRFLMK